MLRLRSRFLAEASNVKHALAAGLLFVAQLSGVGAAAQTPTASIVGAVFDETGALLPGAAVTVVNEGTAAMRLASTDAAGH